MTSASQPKHIVSLDGLRFYAVIMVMIAHWLQWKWTNSFLLQFSFTRGVTLFFVLSGFLITGILLRQKETIDDKKNSIWSILKGFYIRRSLRIFPVYYLLIFFLWIINYKEIRALFPWFLTYTSNIYQSICNCFVDGLGHLWSLAVEEQFYLFWPWLILLIPKKYLLRSIIATVIISLLVKTYFFFIVAKWIATAYFTFSCMHALGLGSILAYVSLNHSKIVDRLSSWYWLLGSVIFYLLLVYFENAYQWNYSKEIISEFVFAVVSSFLILRASKEKFSQIGKFFLENKFVVFSGKVSYGLYVYHQFVPDIYMYLAPRVGVNISNKYLLFCVFYLIALLFASVSWFILERPINQLKAKIPYRTV